MLSSKLNVLFATEVTEKKHILDCSLLSVVKKNSVRSVTSVAECVYHSIVIKYYMFNLEIKNNADNLY